VLLLLAVERLLVNLLLEEGKLLGRPVGGHRVLAMGAGAGGSRRAVGRGCRGLLGTARGAGRRRVRVYTLAFSMLGE
jgi:hypothetical protein